MKPSLRYVSHKKEWFSCKFNMGNFCEISFAEALDGMIAKGKLSAF